jgi:hypothetical protein
MHNHTTPCWLAVSCIAERTLALDAEGRIIIDSHPSIALPLTLELPDRLIIISNTVGL